MDEAEKLHKWQNTIKKKTYTKSRPIQVRGSKLVYHTLKIVVKGAIMLKGGDTGTLQPYKLVSLPARRPKLCAIEQGRTPAVLECVSIMAHRPIGTNQMLRTIGERMLERVTRN